MTFPGGSVSETTKDAQALADMRTLDDWAAQRGNFSWKLVRYRELHFVQLRSGQFNEGTHDTPTGASPDEARAAAAAWVREQKGDK